MTRTPTPADRPWFISNVMNPLFKMTGAFPVVTVRGRRTGKLYSTPINVLDYNGAKYLVSPRGETGWSKNLRVTGEATLKMKGAEQRYHATEIPPEQRAPIIGAYLERWGAQTRSQFDKLPDPIDHPTYRLDPA